ncbi:MAG: DUF2298 domain-containing protein [Eubacterium sp.]|nr:DUF2298 domain-containing protein [Eubacterium sp.]
MQNSAQNKENQPAQNTGKQTFQHTGIGLPAVFFLLLAAACLLLGESFFPFIRWYLLILILGAGFYPLASFLMPDFRDGGWLFSKVIGIAAGGYAVWVLGCAGILPFTGRWSAVVTLAGILLCQVLLWRRWRKRKYHPYCACNVQLLLAEEILFFGFFLLWAYCIGFRPQASGTEKFMDYGFMAAMYRSTSLPAMDIWHGTDPINYYYGGQFFGVYLAKMAQVKMQYAYNVYRAMLSAFGFVLPFSIVYQMVRDRLQERNHPGRWAAAGGLLGGAAVSLAGNGHYVLYGIFGKALHLSMPDDRGYYWFADSTRYIGYNPVNTADRTIHEFPSYSFVLGDVHAHVCNIMFVLLAVALLYAQVQGLRRRGYSAEGMKAEKVPALHAFLRYCLLDPRFLAVAALVGMFQWTNFWDSVIYFTVCLFCVVYGTIYHFGAEWKAGIASAVLRILELTAVSLFFALPFRLQFVSPVSGVAFCQTHTPLYQLLILWGFPVAVFLMLLLHTIWNFQRRHRKSSCSGSVRTALRTDGFVLVLGLCALGLVLIPEIVYVKDIYASSGYPRANTMFKLTYQAFILFGIMLAYAITCAVASARKMVRSIGIVLLAALVLTLGYFPTAVSQYLGNIFDRSGYQGLDATAFLESDYSADASAIEWLNKHAEGQKVVLEVNGDSYSTAGRVSAMTGLPTVLGWYVHEWLWRGDTAELNKRAADIETIYTSQDETLVQALIEKYQIDYIFVGSEEYAKYKNLNTQGLQSLGDVVYSSGTTFILQTDRQQR